MNVFESPEEHFDMTSVVPIYSFKSWSQGFNKYNTVL